MPLIDADCNLINLINLIHFINLFNLINLHSFINLQPLINLPSLPPSLQVWAEAWEKLMEAYNRLTHASEAPEEEKENPADPLAAAKEWELVDPTLPKTLYHLSITWSPTRRRRPGKKGKLPDPLRRHVVNALITKAWPYESQLIDASLLAPAPSFALYGERGKDAKEYHLQGQLRWLSNGSLESAIEACMAFLESCMLIHPDVNNTAELLVKGVGTSATDEHDPRPQIVIDAYPLKDLGKPHSYGFDNYGDEHRALAKAAFDDYYSTAGTTGYRKAQHKFRLNSTYENKIERKNMITLARNHTLRCKALFLGASFFRELCWLFQRGEHVLDPGVIVYGSTSQDKIKLAALISLNTNVNRAATTTLMEIVIDHGQERMRAHEKLWNAVSNRAPWQMPEYVVENLDVFEMDSYVATGQLPIRFERVRHSLRPEMEAKRGAACVIDLGAAAARPGSLTLAAELHSATYDCHRLMFGYDAIDENGDLALAYLAHMLSALPVSEDVPGLFPADRSFSDVLTIVDLMTDNSPEYFYVVHEHMLRGMPADASMDMRREMIVAGLRLLEHVEVHGGIYHGFLSLDEAQVLISRTTDVQLPTYCTNLHCAIVYCDEVVVPDASGAPPVIARSTPRVHHFAVLWEAWDDAQQLRLSSMS